MSYLVVSCPACGWPRVAEAQHASVQCTKCARRIRLASALVHARTPSLEAARDALGQVNAQRAGGELVRELRELPVRPEDDLDRAIAEARDVRSEAARVRRAAEGLGRALGTFTEEQWTEALGRLDVPRARALEHLERLAQLSALAQPRPGTYEWVG